MCLVSIHLSISLSLSLSHTYMYMYLLYIKIKIENYVFKDIVPPKNRILIYHISDLVSVYLVSLSCFIKKITFCFHLVSENHYVVLINNLNTVDPCYNAF